MDETMYLDEAGKQLRRMDMSPIPHQPQPNPEDRLTALEARIVRLETANQGEELKAALAQRDQARKLLGVLVAALGHMGMDVIWFMRHHEGFVFPELDPAYDDGWAYTR